MVPPKKVILILAANPKDTPHLRLDQEVRDIDEGLKRSQKREQFELKQQWAARSRDVRRAILDLAPQIVHFSGHGAGDGGLVLEDESGRSQFVSTEAIAGLFELFADQVECVLLNACYSEVQAKAIAKHIPYVIGMNSSVGDEAALEFAVGFYDGLGAGRDIDFAYKLGCNSISMAGISEDLTPVLLKRSPTNISEPIADLEDPTGQVPPDSGFYVERPLTEEKCYEAIARVGALVRIKAPKQMGKSSLMTKIMSQINQAAALNFHMVDREIWDSLDQFLQWFCRSVTNELRLEDRVDHYWQGRLVSKQKCTNYFERYLLPELKQPIALCLDDVDVIFEHTAIAIDFLGMLRAWHEGAKIKPIWGNLRLVIVHSREVSIPLKITQSPFNVGEEIELRQFTESEVTDLTRRHGLNWSRAEIEPLIKMVGGHPYLLRLALYQIQRGEISLARLLEVAPTEEGLYKKHCI